MNYADGFKFKLISITGDGGFYKSFIGQEGELHWNDLALEFRTRRGRCNFQTGTIEKVEHNGDSDIIIDKYKTKYEFMKIKKIADMLNIAISLDDVYSEIYGNKEYKKEKEIKMSENKVHLGSIVMDEDGYYYLVVTYAGDYGLVDLEEFYESEQCWENVDDILKDGYELVDGEIIVVDEDKCSVPEESFYEKAIAQANDHDLLMDHCKTYIEKYYNKG